jgi:multidrug transporter EmrE-like cation transporter
MHFSPKMYVILGIITTVIAQISLKRAGGVDTLKSNWLILVSLSLSFYVMSFVSYYFALRNFDISTIQPIMMASIVTLIALYGFAVGESFNYLKAIGILLAAFSIFLISKS